MSLGFTTVNPGSIPVHPSRYRFTPLASRWRPGYDPVFVGIENNRDRGEPGRHRGKPGNTVAKSLKSICPCGFRFILVNSTRSPGLYRNSLVSRLPTVCAVSSRFYPVTSFTVHPD